MLNAFRDDAVLYSLIGAGLGILLCAIFVFFRQRCRYRDKISPEFGYGNDDESLALKKVDRRDYVLSRIRVKKTKRRSIAAVVLAKAPPRPSYHFDIEDEKIPCHTLRHNGEVGGIQSSQYSTEKKSFLSRAFAAFLWSKKPEVVDEKIYRCNICLCDFSEGEDICSSFNMKCPHRFHIECIVEWLMDTDKCPCCRLNYLKGPDTKMKSNTPVENNEIQQFSDSGTMKAPKVGSMDMLVTHVCDNSRDGFTASDDDSMIIRGTGRIQNRMSMVDIGFS